jgi:FtsH-binding integral membrane protein
MENFALLTVALLFGGMLLFSIGFGAMVFKHLPPDQARPFIRQTFPYFYMFVLAASLVSALALLFVDYKAALAMLFIFATTLPTRQILMPAINVAADNQQKKKVQVPAHYISCDNPQSYCRCGGSSLLIQLK